MDISEIILVMYWLFILSGGIFCWIFFGTRKARRSGNALDSLIIAADRGDKAARKLLWEERDRRKISGEDYIRYRRSLYTRLAQKGDAFAEYELGEDALLILRQPRAAYDYYRRAADKGCTEAMTRLALLYATGSEGFEENLPLSFQWYMCAANAGDTKAMAEVSSCYHSGYGVEKNLEGAIYWASKGAKAGSAKCVFQLAECYNTLPPAPEKKATRLKYLEQAMRMGDGDVYEKAANSLGYFFGSAYIYNLQLEDQYTDRRKAAYCFTLAWVCDTDNDYVKENLQKVGYRTSQREFEQWRADALALRYNP